MIPSVTLLLHSILNIVKAIEVFECSRRVWWRIHWLANVTSASTSFQSMYLITQKCMGASPNHFAKTVTWSNTYIQTLQKASWSGACLKINDVLYYTFIFKWPNIGVSASEEQHNMVLDEALGPGTFVQDSPRSMPNADQWWSKYWHWSQFRWLALRGISDQCHGFDWHWSGLGIDRGSPDL